MAILAEMGLDEAGAIIFGEWLVEEKAEIIKLGDVRFLKVGPHEHLDFSDATIRTKQTRGLASHAAYLLDQLLHVLDFLANNSLQREDLAAHQGPWGPSP